MHNANLIKNGGRSFSFVKDAEVENVRETTVPENTKKHTAWSSNVYKEWAQAREKEFKDFESENKEFVSIPPITEIDIPQINYWLSKFAMEVRKKMGQSTAMKCYTLCSVA